MSMREHLAASICLLFLILIPIGTLNFATSALTFAWMAPLMNWYVGDKSEIPLTTSDTSWLVSLFEVGELMGTIPAGLLADRFGRRTLLGLIGPLSCVASLIILFTRSIWSLALARLIQGPTVAIAFTVGPMYLAEISSPAVRGLMTAQVQTGWFVGVTLAYVLGSRLSYTNYTIATATVSAAFWFLLLLVPESPYFFLIKGKEKEATSALAWLRGEDDVENELRSTKASIQGISSKGTWTELFTSKTQFKHLLIVQLVCCVKYLGGIAAVSAYGATTFVGKGFSDFDENDLSIIVFAVISVTTFLGSLFTDRIGRRKMIISSTMCTTFLSCLTAAFYFINDKTHLNTSGLNWVGATLVLGFAVTSNVGLGPLLQTVQAEYFPTHLRGLAGGITELIASAAIFINLKLYQPIIDYVGLYGNYVLYGIILSFGVIIFYIYIPETSTIELEDVSNQIQKKKKEECGSS